jgi:hypothetical protein
MCSFYLDNLNRCVTCGSNITLCSAAVATPATARLAHSSRLAIRENKQLHLIAGLHADIETLTALRELGMLLSKTLVEAVAFSGRLHILQHLLSEPHCPHPDTLSYYAARCGSISMLIWLRPNRWCRYDAYTCEGAAEGGQLAALKHLRSAGCDWYAHSTAHSAAVSGSIELLEWLRPQQGIQITALTLAWAADFGQTAMCEHLLSTGCERDADACCYAAKNGRLETLRWLRGSGCPWIVSDVCDGAAQFGSTDILDYVVEQGEVLEAELLTKALNSAGTNDQLQAAQWLRQRGAEWPDVLGHDEDEQWSDAMIAWAREQGCTSPLPPPFEYDSYDENDAGNGIAYEA